jgi:EgtB-related family protein
MVCAKQSQISARSPSLPDAAHAVHYSLREFLQLDRTSYLMSITRTDGYHLGGTLALLDRQRLAAALREVRERTLGLIADLDEKQMIGPRLAIVNPPLWEIGHIAWFTEFWLLRHLKKQPPLLPNGDQLYNSSDVAHDTRWELLLPARDRTLNYMGEVFDRALEGLAASRELYADESYFYLLTLFHEGMHDEALAYTRQTLAYPPPKFTQLDESCRSTGAPCTGDVDIPGGKFIIGATQDFPFVFDNEKWAHEIELRPFRIARASVTNGEFLAFVEAQGYRKREYWSAAGWRWRERGGSPELEQSFANFFSKDLKHGTEDFKAPVDHPVYWQRRANGTWSQRIYDRDCPLNERAPVVHVSWFEAEAYCNWAHRRLPTEAEWEVAASAQIDATGGLSRARRYFPWGDSAPNSTTANLDWRRSGPVAVDLFAAGDSAFGCRQMIGNVWEWTADDFKPYPGFVIDPYKEYSKPWFGTHKVLRGGCWATSSLLIRNTWRNFYTPDRRDVWAGFRTCAKTAE